MARILVADDDVPMRELMSLACRMDGHVVEESIDTATTVAACVAWRPDLLLLDLSMPGGGGTEVLRQLRFATGGIPCPVVVVSGVLEQLSDAELEELGAAARVAKPFTLQQLRNAIREALLAHGGRQI
jgi:CheY-like chemotaxis protein